MRRSPILAAMVAIVAGCSSSGFEAIRVPTAASRAESRAQPRSIGHVPPGHYPPPGECRVWFPGRPPGHQPPPARCDRIGAVPYGAFVLYNAKAWDTEYDWARHARVNPGSVPDIVLRVMASVRGG